MIRARIVGTGKHLPEKVYTNKDLEQFADTTDEWIRQRTGIHQRHVAPEGSGLSDMLEPASRQALEEAGIQPAELDCIIVGTLSGDYMFPATASVLQARLGADKAACHDVNAACSGFLYSLATANAFIQTGLYKNVLIAAGELVSNQIVYKNRDTGVLFGDGAGAAVLRADNGDRGVLSMYLGSDGAGGDALIRPHGGSKSPGHGMPREESFFIQMKGQELFKKAVVRFPEAAQKALDATGLCADDVDLFVPHQANVRIIEAAAQRMGFPMDRVFINMDRVANTVAGSIPIALHEAREQHRIKDNDHVLLASFGAGLTWGSSMIKW